MTDIASAIKALKDDAEFVVSGEPSNEAEYQRKRAAEYPAVVDQLDEIYHNGIDGWKTKIKAVKDKYPKS